MPSSKKQFSNVIKMQGLIVELESKVSELDAEKRRLLQELKDEQIRITKLSVELNNVRTLLGRSGYDGEPLNEYIKGLIGKYDESLSGHRRNIESLKEENGRLWYMVGVAMKDPNTLRSYKKIGARPSYVQPTYGDTVKENY